MDFDPLKDSVRELIKNLKEDSERVVNWVKTTDFRPWDVPGWIVDAYVDVWKMATHRDFELTADELKEIEKKAREKKEEEEIINQRKRRAAEKKLIDVVEEEEPVFGFRVVDKRRENITKVGRGLQKLNRPFFSLGYGTLRRSSDEAGLRWVIW